MEQQKIANSTLLNVDCMEYMRTLPDKFFDLAIVDPPYGIKRLSANENIRESSKYRKSMANMVASAKSWNHLIPTEEYFSELFRISNEQIVWGANNFSMPKSEYFVIWDKQQTIKNFASAEYAWCSQNKWKKPAKVFTYQIHVANAVENKIHPTKKPVKLYEWLLTNYAKPGQTIFDSHMGSGSSAIAAINLGFEYVGCELDADYYAAACKRIAQNAQQERLFA